MTASTVSRQAIGKANPVPLQGAVGDAVFRECRDLDEGKDATRPEALEVFEDMAKSGNASGVGKDAEKAILEY